MRVHELKSGRFLKKEDVDPAVLVTITKCTQEEMPDGELKWCLHFKEMEKPLTLNSTNGQLIETILGSDNSDDWNGKKIVLYNEPTIMYAGKVTGGIRVRSPKGQPKQAAPDPASEADDNEIPF